MAAAAQDPPLLNHPIIVEMYAAYRIATVRLMIGALTAAAGAVFSAVVLWHVERTRDLSDVSLLVLLTFLALCLGIVIFGTYQLLAVRIRFKAERAKVLYNLDRWGEDWQPDENEQSLRQKEWRERRAREGKFGPTRQRPLSSFGLEEAVEPRTSEPGRGE
ncbi:hypothetical protein [Nocardia sp. NPDC050435]|uniref:hypothetical protein n=1 Tax=Nocardia sp. NPDC050435 TaxID=3155040 RepID=UPI0033C881B9